MKIIKTAADFCVWKKERSESLGFVPTLGALHNGHLSLVSTSQKQCCLTVVSIFLNPTQFSPNEDLTSYPQSLEADIKLLEGLSVDVLFLPTQREMYHTVEDVNVPPTALFGKLEGASRPHFFYGVTTIVAKLFNVIQPTHTFFGKKDAQQLYIIKQMIRMMNYQIILVSCPTLRDKNGLALSSRNQYLTAEEQTKASVIYRGLMHIKDALDRGQKNTAILKQSFETILQQVSEIRIDYISITCTKALTEITNISNDKILVSTAVFFNDVRLIDNFTYSSSTT